MSNERQSCDSLMTSSIALTHFEDPLGPIYTIQLVAYASLRKAFDMTQDHLHAHDIFTYKIKYAKVCTGIYGEKVLTNRKQIFQLFCALKIFSNEMFFALIRSVLFEKRLPVILVNKNFLRHFDGRKLRLRPLLSRNLSQNSSFLSISATIVAAF